MLQLLENCNQDTVMHNPEFIQFLREPLSPGNAIEVSQVIAPL